MTPPFPFANFQKIHLFWRRQASLKKPLYQGIPAVYKKTLLAHSLACTVHAFPARGHCSQGRVTDPYMCQRSLLVTYEVSPAAESLQ